MKTYEKIDVTQSYEEFPEEEYEMQGKFTKNCLCGKTHELRTQRDDCPEYYTMVMSRCCNCGEFVKFELPVN